MGKLGGLLVIALLALTGCSAASAQTPEPASTFRGEVQPAAAFDSAKVPDFVQRVQGSGSSYATMPRSDIAGMAPELCQHYDGGFTTEDLRKSAGDKLAEAGEAARLTVCPPR